MFCSSRKPGMIADYRPAALLPCEISRPKAVFTNMCPVTHHEVPVVLTPRAVRREIGSKGETHGQSIMASFFLHLSKAEKLSRRQGEDPVRLRDEVIRKLHPTRPRYRQRWSPIRRPGH